MADNVQNVRFRNVSNRSEYSFDCPVGAWRGRLDAKAWGRKSNLLLYFSEVDGGGKFALSVYWTNQHRPASGGIDFRVAGERGEIFDLLTERTSNGTSKLVSATYESDRHQPMGVQALEGIGGEPLEGSGFERETPEEAL